MADEKETPKESVSKSKLPAKFDEAWNAAVATWMDTTMRGSAVAQSTEAWNHLNANLPELRRLLEREL